MVAAATAAALALRGAMVCGRKVRSATLGSRLTAECFSGLDHDQGAVGSIIGLAIEPRGQDDGR